MNCNGLLDPVDQKVKWQNKHVVIHGSKHYSRLHQEINKEYLRNSKEPGVPRSTLFNEFEKI